MVSNFGHDVNAVAIGGTTTDLSWRVNIMPGDNLAMQGAKSSSSVMLTNFPQNGQGPRDTVLQVFW